VHLQKPEPLGDAAKQVSAALAEQMAKGKKMATWALTSRHHNSHPQLPCTRPKKPFPERGEPSGKHYVGHFPVLFVTFIHVVLAT